jgi:acetoin utilization deacetylase AcuC-like enzyme
VQLLKEAGHNGIVHVDPDTYVNAFSYEAAIKAAGGMIDCAKKIYIGELNNGIVLSRPPGHHATQSRSMGFCLFNTIALGARSCILEQGCSKTAIVDIDVHHGNGTQWIFYNDPLVLYISTHQYPHYPGSGSMEEIGKGEGKGTTINIPFPAYTGDPGYNQAVEEVIVPALERFQPGQIFVSVGFDAHNQDPLSSIHISLSGYDNICRTLIQTAGDICEGKILFSLEGGYNLDVLGPGIGNIVRALTGDSSCDDPLSHYSGNTAYVDGLLQRIKHIHGL